MPNPPSSRMEWTRPPVGRGIRRRWNVPMGPTRRSTLNLGGCMELGVRLFLCLPGISKRKLELAGQWGADLLLLGCHVDLKHDLVELPNPKISGASTLINSDVFNPRNYDVGLHDVQELRGCINHWPNKGRIWRWLVPPINQLLEYADSTNMWIRCNDLGKWTAFWNTIGFIREIANGERNWPTLFTGSFSELVGLTQELNRPSGSREVIWFSGDATPSFIGGIKWKTREFFV